MQYQQRYFRQQKPVEYVPGKGIITLNIVKAEMRLDNALAVRPSVHDHRASFG